ncbi:hypothetical protein GPAL_3471 [Glaciecola pallidula DSM 14239 = ACAM 615]|uniref:Uncharacterized protein n=1 Tax=Brumicola pallidula DSM 14239 = ACAM 615 TaxID=1121922 RepID=K6YC81_9ALTE|nr:hypothetical protein GPAL_3471 [Glaciecola pallidula DSM 14239 = ACAM 615]
MNANRSNGAYKQPLLMLIPNRKSLDIISLTTIFVAKYHNLLICSQFYPNV